MPVVKDHDLSNQILVFFARIGLLKYINRKNTKQNTTKTL